MIRDDLHQVFTPTLKSDDGLHQVFTLPLKSDVETIEDLLGIEQPTEFRFTYTVQLTKPIDFLIFNVTV